MKRLLILLIILFLVVPVAVARAATPNGIEVKPVRNYPALDRGSTGTGSLTLTNNTSAAQNISMSVETFGVTGENYDYSFSTSEEVNWISFAEPKFTLQPKQTKSVSYSIAVPGDATAGGHYFSLLTIIDPPQDGEGVTEIRRVASLLYLEVSGSITKKSNLVSFSLPWFTTKPTIPTEVNLSNSGTSHSRARVLVTGRSWLSLLLRQPANQYALIEGTIVPSTVRRLPGEVKLPVSPGVYKITAEYAPNQGGIVRINKTVVYSPVWFIILTGAALVGILIVTLRYVVPPAKTRLRRTSSKD